MLDSTNRTDVSLKGFVQLSLRLMQALFSAIFCYFLQLADYIDLNFLAQ